MSAIEPNRVQSRPTSAGEAHVSAETIRDAQEALNYLAGADLIEVTGTMTVETREQLKQFQMECGLDTTGELDATSMDAILEAVVARNDVAGSAISSRRAEDIGVELPDARPGRPHATMRVNIHFRSFAPFENFAGFRGDARSFSADPAASSRMRTRVEIATRQNTAQIHHSSSGTRDSLGLTGMAFARPRGEARMERLGEGVSRMTFSQSGANPTVPGSPNVDRRGEVLLDETVPGRLRLHISATGDDFPNAEMSVTDITGQALFLDGFATSGGAHSGALTLFGEDDAQLLHRDVEVLVDDRGRFLGVMRGNGEPMSIEDWNRALIRAEETGAPASRAGTP